MPPQHFLSIPSVPVERLQRFLAVSADLKGRQFRGIREYRLAGRTLALIFEKPSLRTRVSFEVAMYQLGGHALSLDRTEVGLGERESVRDVAGVLSGLVSAVAIRTFSQARVEELARHARVPVINGLSDSDHPCQALADLLTLWESFGRIVGLRVAYIGDANNVAKSLIEAVTRLGGHVICAAPRTFQFSAEQLAALRAGAAAGGSVELTDDPRAAASGADALYTDTWVSMGQETAAAQKIQHFAGYQINSDLLARAKPNAVVMHCLPAHRGQEITDEVIDGPQSVVYRQAENRLHAQKGLLWELLGG